LHNDTGLIFYKSKKLQDLPVQPFPNDDGADIDCFLIEKNG